MTLFRYPLFFFLSIVALSIGYPEVLADPRAPASPAESFTQTSFSGLSQPPEELTATVGVPAVADELRQELLVPISELPIALRQKLPITQDPLYSYKTGLRFDAPVEPTTNVFVEKPWLAEAKPGAPRSAPGYCPLKVSYGARQLRQEERPNIPWPYERTETLMEDGVEIGESVSTRNLGKFYALIDPGTGMYGMLVASSRMTLKNAVTQAEIDALCKTALRSYPVPSFDRMAFGDDTDDYAISPSPFVPGRLVRHPIRREPAKSRTFLNHLPSDVKSACPGGGRDTFAATFGVFFKLTQRTIVVPQSDPDAPMLPEEILECTARTQVCCFNSEAAYPLHSLYAGESGRGYDNPDPEYVPNEEELTQRNYAYSLLGSRGLFRGSFAADELPDILRLPSGTEEKDSWLKRTSPVQQPPWAPFPTKEDIVSVR